MVKGFTKNDPMEREKNGSVQKPASYILLEKVSRMYMQLISAGIFVIFRETLKLGAGHAFHGKTCRANHC